MNRFCCKSGGDASEAIKSTEDNKRLMAEKEAEVKEARAALYAKLEIIGNLVHDSVPVSNDEVCKDFLLHVRLLMIFKFSILRNVLRC